MAEDYGTLWYVLSFWAVGIAQQPLLVGVSLPLCSVHIRSGQSLFSNGDKMAYTNYVLFALCVSAILTAESADTSLQKFMVENKMRVEKGQKKVPIKEVYGNTAIQIISVKFPFGRCMQGLHF